MRIDNTPGSFPVITEQGVDELRQRIGVKIEKEIEPWCHEATRDNIRHYAHGIGDDNPLWCDPDYAAKTSYGVFHTSRHCVTSHRVIVSYASLRVSYASLRERNCRKSIPFDGVW